MQKNAVVFNGAEVDPEDSDMTEHLSINPVVPGSSLELDVSGQIGVPVPQACSGDRCVCCGLNTTKLWDGARAGRSESHAVCTLCYLTGHLDSPTSAHGRLAYLPDLSIADAIHLQRRALLAMVGGSAAQQKQGKRIWEWMDKHAREVEVAWHTARACEFAEAMKRLPQSKREELQERLRGCVLVLPADMFEDLSLLLPEGKTVQSVLSSHSWATYTRSDLYV